jgi:molybdopterin converting factor small subunit
MTVTVLLFASYADAVGRSSIELDLRAGATVDDVIERVRCLGDGDRLPAQPLVAVNEQYAARSLELHGGDEIALIPPVAGG